MEINKIYISTTFYVLIPQLLCLFKECRCKFRFTSFAFKQLHIAAYSFTVFYSFENLVTPL